MHRLPILVGVVGADRIDIDHARVTAGAIADQPRGRNRREADAEIEAFADRGLALDQTDIGMDLAQGPVAHAARPLVGVELLANPAAEPDLIEPRAVADLDGEGARADLGEERAGIAFLDRVEAVLTVGDQPGEHVEAPGRALRIGEAGDGRAELELLDQRHEIDAARLEHRALGQVDLVKLELGELVAHRGVRTGKEARADAVSDLAEPEIEARGLDLVGLDLRRAMISPPAIIARMAWQGRMPVRAKALARLTRRRLPGRVGEGFEKRVGWAGWLHGVFWHLPRSWSPYSAFSPQG